LAISADANSGYVLRDRFARHFGVWREIDHGRGVAFDLLFPRGLELPRRGASPLKVVRSYRPVHNIGHFRYAEAARIGEDGQPSGDLTLWDDIQFPFDPALRSVPDLTLIDLEPPERGRVRGGRGILGRCQRRGEGGDLQPFGRLPAGVHARPMVKRGAASGRGVRGEARLGTASPVVLLANRFSDGGSGGDVGDGRPLRAAREVRSHLVAGEFGAASPAAWQARPPWAPDEVECRVPLVLPYTHPAPALAATPRHTSTAERQGWAVALLFGMNVRTAAQANPRV
jgi:hypothetical protein